MSSSSYLDTRTLLSPTFTPQSHASALIHATNNSSDTPLDLTTPLSRALFDLQEVDTRIDALTTSNAGPIITLSADRAQASGHVLETLEERVGGLQESYERLSKEVGERYEAAEQVRLAAQRMVRTLRLGRSVQRALVLGRALQDAVREVGMPGGKGGERAMGPAARAVVELRGLFAGEEAEGLGRVHLVATLRNEVVVPGERTLLARCQAGVREFSLSSLAGGQQGQGAGQGGSGSFRETEEAKSRVTCALQALWLLSPLKLGTGGAKAGTATTTATTTVENFNPTLLIAALQTYLQTALTSSLASLARALATLPTLDRTLLEIAARCQNIVALEALLENTGPPPHPLLSPSPAAAKPPNFLAPLLAHLDTSSLPSYFWRSLAGQLSSRVQEILNRGGVSARTLRSNKEKVREAVRDCVERGSRLPGGAGKGREGERVGGWEREAAVMVGSIVGPLGR